MRIVPDSTLIGRRNFLANVGVGFTSAALATLPVRLFANAPAGLNLDAVYKVVPVGSRQKPIFMIWLEGGMSHIDTFSPIPTAPDNIRGPYSTIPTSVPGVRLSEMLPRTARQMHKIALMRNIKHADHNHSSATSLMFSGSPREKDGRKSHYESFAVRMGKHFSESNIGYVTFNADPGNPYLYAGVGEGESLHIKQRSSTIDSDNVGNTPYPSPFGTGFDSQRHRSRTALLRNMNTNVRSNTTERWDQLVDRANSMLDGDLNRAFDLTGVPDRVRDRYGKTSFGNAVLVGKRMTDAGAPFVLVNKVGWDNHSGIKAALDSALPELDRIIANLFEDLGDRAIIAVGTEFGRTPVINSSNGRDHWANSGFLVVGGAGITPRVVGALDNRGEIAGNDGIYQGELMGPTIARAAGYKFVEERAGVLTTNEMPYYPIFS